MARVEDNAKPRVVFWDVDTQVDFMLPGGKLYVTGAETIIPKLQALALYARANHIPVISSADAHEPGDPEFEHFGEHCLVDTPGQQKLPETLLPERLIIPKQRLDELPELAAAEQVIIEKDKLDVFMNPNTDRVVNQLGSKLNVILYGVVTEICVAAAANGLLARGHEVYIVSDAVRHLDEVKAQAGTAELCRRGAKMTSTGEVPTIVQRYV